VIETKILRACAKRGPDCAKNSRLGQGITELESYSSRESAKGGERGSAIIFSKPGENRQPNGNC
jgi:hypothetical protein